MNKRMSPSALSDFVRCPRCFWLDRVKGIKKPRGIFPSLPGKMDELLKKRYDLYRGNDSLPPEMQGSFDGVLFKDQRKMDEWRDWRSGLVANVDGIEVSGKLDDLLWDPKTNLVSVIDYKTKGDPPGEDYSTKYYQLQADCYDLMLSENGLLTSGKAYFVYYFPMKVKSADKVLFNVKVQAISTVPKNAATVAKQAVTCLEGLMPLGLKTCETCVYVNARVANKKR